METPTEVELLVDNTVLEVFPVPQVDVIEVFQPRVSDVFEIINDGPQGVKGDNGTDAISTIDVLAAEDLPAFTIVTATGLIADSSNTGHYGKVVGITTEDVALGFIAKVITDVEVTNDAWSWSPGDHIFLNGTTLSTTPPTTGFCQMVAIARNANIIVVKLETPILL